jgi:mannosyltransferase
MEFPINLEFIFPLQEKNTKRILLEQIPIALILLLATGLRLYQLSTESLCIDEMLSIRDAEKFQFTLPYLRPFYYLLLKLWMLFGNSDTWLRGLSIVFGLGSIYLTYWLGCRIVGKSTGLVAALLASVSPLFINHAQEIRMYTLISCLSLAGTVALSYLLERPTYKTLIGWATTRTFLILTNPNNILILLADTVLLGWKFRKQRQWLLVSGVGLSMISLFFLPIFWLLTVGGEFDEFMGKQVEDYSKPGITQILGILTQFTVYWPLRNLLQSHQIILNKNELTDSMLFSQLFTVKTLSILFYAGFTAVLIVLLVLSLLNIFSKHPSERLVWLATFALLPAGFMLLLSYYKSSIWFPRYLMLVAPYFLILISAGFVVIWNWKKGVAVAISLAYLMGVTGGLFDYYTQLYRNDWQGAAQYIYQNHQPNDLVVMHSTSDFFKLSLSRYYPEKNNVYLLNHPGSDKKLTPAYIQQQLGNALPLKSNFWFVCWLFCKQKKEINRVFSTVAGEPFKIEQQKTFSSLEFQPIQVFKITPAVSAQKLPNPE